MRSEKAYPDSLRIGLRLLDRQILDRDGSAVGKVDDLELDLPDSPEDGAPPEVSALLCGPAALGPRLAGRLGRWWEQILRRAEPDEPEPARIAMTDVAEIGTAVRLRTPAPDTTGAIDDWLRDNVIAKIPGGRA